jgi:hypothetical protein
VQGGQRRFGTSFATTLNQKASKLELAIAVDLLPKVFTGDGY